MRLNKINITMVLHNLKSSISACNTSLSSKYQIKRNNY